MNFSNRIFFRETRENERNEWKRNYISIFFISFFQSLFFFTHGGQASCEIEVEV